MAKQVSSSVMLTNKNYLAEAKTRNHFLTIDEPVSAGGDDNGPTPVEYLLTALGSCVAITLRMYAERKGWDVGKIKVNVTQKEELTTEGIRKSLVEDISFEKEVTSKQREKLVEIAGKCPVAKMIKSETKITSILN
uniref:OsmC family protein n=1 Tax=uncultured Polaribacter sp. TaxID=174711 RepID=UPI00260A6EDE|nr:OsmC family protein [uncultured Polaribacter sp.]